jgi:hypothetical protein
MTWVILVRDRNNGDIQCLRGGFLDRESADRRITELLDDSAPVAEYIPVEQQWLRAPSATWGRLFVEAVIPLDRE